MGQMGDWKPNSCKKKKSNSNSNSNCHNSNSKRGPLKTPAPPASRHDDKAGRFVLVLVFWIENCNAFVRASHVSPAKRLTVNCKLSGVHSTKPK